MKGHAILQLLVLALLGACASPEASRDAAPDPRVAADLELATELLGRGRRSEARELLEGIIERAVYEVEAHRRLQNLRIESRERNALLREYASRLAAEPDRGEWHYLLGRLLHRIEDQRAAFQAARDRDPTLPWGHYGLAWAALVELDLATARRHVESCLRAAPGHPLARVLLARLMLLQQKPAEAGMLLDTLLKQHPRLTEAWSLRASVAAAAGDRDLEIAARARVLELDPFAADERNRLVAIIEQGAGSAAALLALDALRPPPEGSDPSWYVALARIERARGRAAASRLLARQAFDAGRRDLVLREILESGPDWLAARLEYYGLEGGALPAALVNLLSAPTPDDPKALLRRAGDLFAVGFVNRAERAALAALELDPDRAAPVVARIHAHRRVEARLKLLVDRLDDESSGAVGEELEAFLDRLAEIIEEETGYAAGEGNEILGLPLVGSALDSTGALSGSINGYFRRTNQILYAGRLAGSRVQALLFTMLGGPREVRPAGWSLERSCQEVVGMLAVTRPADALFGDSGGRALFGGYYLDLDVLVPWQARFGEVTGIAPEEQRRLLEDEGLPAANDRELRDIDRPGDAADALVLRTFAIHGSLPLIEHVRIHEQGHLIDSQRYLPIWRKILPNLALLLRSGFDSTAVMADLEAAAELHALRAGPAPHLVLAEMIRALPRGPDAGPHSRGYREILRAFIDELARRLDEFPALRRDRILLHQLHRLREEEIRALAAAL